MTLEELEEACSATNPLTGEPVEHVCLVTTRVRPPEGLSVCLFGRSGPRGRIACVKERPDGQYDVVGYYRARDIRKLLKPKR